VSRWVQRCYAYAVLLLREMALTSPNSRLYAWKARTTMVMSQGLLAVAAAMTATVDFGWYLPWRYPLAWPIGGGLLGLTLFLLNSGAERHLLPRFEREFRQLTKTRRLVGRTVIILYFVLTIAAFLGSVAAGHAALCSRMPTGVSLKC
jgi:hypothetical protein